MKKTALAMSAVFIVLSACATPPVAALPEGTPIVGGSVTHRPEEGLVTVECTVAQNRALSECAVIAEEPSGQGFGQAALDVAQKGRLASSSSKPGDRVRFTTRFRMAD